MLKRKYVSFCEIFSELTSYGDKVPKGFAFRSGSYLSFQNESKIISNLTNAIDLRSILMNQVISPWNNTYTDQYFMKREFLQSMCSANLGLLNRSHA